MRRSFLGLVVALSLLASGCATTPTVPIGMKEYPADIVYGDQSTPAPPPPVPAADPRPAFPGFIAPPAPRPPSPTSPPTTRQPTTTLPVVRCPADNPLDVPKREASPSVGSTPSVGRYPFRQTGHSKVDGTVVATLAPETEHQVDAIRDVALESFRFDVGVLQGDATTTTTYEVNRRGVENGLHIAQIRTSDPLGTSAFTPSAPVKLLPFPAVIGARWRSAGTDPLHQVTLSINGLVRGKTRVNACGTPLDAWLVEVGRDPQTDQPSRIVGPQKSIELTGTYAVATQFGGMIIAENITMRGSDQGQQVEVTRDAAINNSNPRPLGAS
ncbi:MAG: hypothetical protein ACR2H3_07245 [Acidimicrobiales bacterium]